ncbi:hypothetical protein [Lysobacter sp. CA199]|uniref:hypothetical protein n=1 Tax=Lysobacter sp. CA199 TaxID=3455608 RepID=UPI003F8D1980
MLTRIVALASTLLILTACTQQTPTTAAIPGKTTVLDLPEDTRPPLSITEQVAIAEKNNEGGSAARYNAERKKREKAKAEAH